MFEHSKSQLASKKKFTRRLFKAGTVSLLIFFISLSLGIIGYHTFAEMSWVNSFFNASMILGGMGPTGELPNPESKIFAGVYAIYSGVIFLLGMAIFAVPVVHRFMHKFHIEEGKDNE